MSKVERKKRRRRFEVKSGSLHWTGQASSAEEAVIKALDTAPERLGALVKIRDGWRWFYLDSIAALKLAGYSVLKKVT